MKQINQPTAKCEPCQPVIKIQISGDVLLSAQGEDQQDLCWTHGFPPPPCSLQPLGELMREQAGPDRSLQFNV